MFCNTPSAKEESMLNSFSLILEELLDFGKRIKEQEFNQNENSHLSIASLIFLTNYLDILESTSLLIKNGNSETITILLRSALDISVQLEYLLQNNEELKAKSFIYIELIEQLELREELLHQNGESKSNDPFYIEFNTDEKDIAQMEINNIKKRLNADEFKVVSNEYNKRKKKSNLKWYNLFNGPENPWKLFKILNQESKHKFLYGLWSKNIHGVDFKNYSFDYEKDSNKILLTPMNLFENSRRSFLYCFQITISFLDIYFEKRTLPLKDDFKVLELDLIRKIRKCL